MIALVFVTCLSSEPGNCQEHSLLYQDVSAMSCMLGAQPELAKWTVEHPGWQINSWSCRMIVPGERDA